MITIEHVSKVYHQGQREVVALQDVSLQIERGTIYGILGESGAGKSTLLRCVNLLERPTSGIITIDGQEITSLSGSALRQARRRIGIIFQAFNLLSSRTVAENIALPLEVEGLKRNDRQKRVKELLELVGLQDRASAYPAQLSGGQKQRVGIARALAARPTVLLSDEATSALDPQTTTSILALLKKLNREMGLTILLITHEMSVVRQICDRVAVIKAGRIIEEGAVTDLLLQPTSHLSQGFFPTPVTTDSTAPENLFEAVVTVVFDAASGGDRLVSDLSRRFNLEVTILSGSVESVGDAARVGRLQLKLQGSEVRAALDYLKQNYALGPANTTSAEVAEVYE